LDTTIFTVLLLQQDPEPEYDPATHYLLQQEAITLGEPEGLLHRTWEKKPIPPPPPQPEWAQFSDVIYSNSALRTAMASASTFLQVRLGVGLGLARSGLAEDIESFALAWDDAVAEGLISQQLGAGFYQLAQQFNLPASFIERLQGAP
jgi:hypothetical protein